MHDMNFFSPYIEVKKASKFKAIYIILIVGLLIVSIASFSIWSYLKVKDINAKIEEMKQFLSSETVKEKIRIFEETTTKVEIMNKYNTELGAFLLGITSGDKIHSDLLIRLSGCLPKDLFIQSMSVSQSSILIQGSAESRTAIAEFERNVKELPDFDVVFINNINKTALRTDDTNTEGKTIYNFSMKCNMGVGNKNEAN